MNPLNETYGLLLQVGFCCTLFVRLEHQFRNFEYISTTQCLYCSLTLWELGDYWLLAHGDNLAAIYHGKNWTTTAAIREKGRVGVDERL